MIRRTTQPGFTLIEATMSIVVVSVMLVGALRLLGSARAGELTAQRRAVAHALAQDLMSEIVDSNYADPDDGDTLGAKIAEITGNRSLFDDVGDYDTWTASPPQAKDGTELADFAGYERTVSVEWAQLDTLTLDSGSASGVKRITVTVNHGGRTHATLVAYRTDAYDPGPPTP